MPDVKSKLLIVEDDVDVAEMLNAYFRVQDYEVVNVDHGADITRVCRSSIPDLIILHTHLPDIDGVDMIRRIRRNRRTARVPFIILTDKSEPIDRLEILKLGVVDFVNMPFDVQELRLRVRNALHRASQDSLVNPVTGLPEGLLVDEHLNDCLESSTWTLLIASLLNLESFREIYGNVAFEDVLRGVSLMIQYAVEELGDENDFLGHLSASDFILITKQASITPLQERILNRVTQSLDYFYPIKDREKSLSRGERVVFKLGILKSDEDFFPSLDMLKTTLKQKNQ